MEATAPQLKENKKGLSKFEVFGLTSGSLGIIADVISLSALFKMTSAGVEIPRSSWITPLILIIYTGVIVGFYSRRLLCYLNRGRAKNEKITKRGYARIEQASIAITYLITGTLWLMLLYSVYPKVSRMIDEGNSQTLREINEKYEKRKAKATPEEIERLEEAKKTDIKVQTERGMSIMFYWSFGLFLLIPLALFINYLSGVIYKGCDINYQAI